MKGLKSWVDEVRPPTAALPALAFGLLIGLSGPVAAQETVPDTTPREKAKQAQIELERFRENRIPRARRILADGLLGLDFDGFTRLRVASRTRFAFGNTPGAEANQRDFLSLFEGSRHAMDHAVNSSRRGDFCDACILCDLIDQHRFVHLFSPPFVFRSVLRNRVTRQQRLHPAASLAVKQEFYKTL